MRSVTETKSYVAPVVLQADPRRSALEVYVTSGSVELQIGGGSGTIPVTQTTPYLPIIVSTSEISITGVGTYVVHSNPSTLG